MTAAFGLIYGAWLARHATDRATIWIVSVVFIAVDLIPPVLGYRAGMLTRLAIEWIWGV